MSMDREFDYDNQESLLLRRLLRESRQMQLRLAERILKAHEVLAKLAEKRPTPASAVADQP